MKIGSDEWLWLRQKAYDAAVAYYRSPRSPIALGDEIDIHKAAVQEIDKLPVSQGGRDSIADVPTK